jgi:hypothetical protein
MSENSKDYSRNLNEIVRSSCTLVRYCDEQFLKAEMAEAVHLTPVQFDVAAGQLLQVRAQYAG